jgi:TrkA domain protein
MADVRETKLPGVGVRHEFTTGGGQQVGVLVHRDGRREIIAYDRADPDACSSIVELSADDTRTMSELLGGSRVTQAVEQAVQQTIEGLAIEWIELPAGGASVGTTIGDGAYRTKTGASIVAIIRGDTTIPAPGPDAAFAAHDVVVAVGTSEGLAALREILRR